MPQPLDGRIDAAIQQVVNGFDDAPYFLKAEAMELIVERPQFSRTIDRLRTQFRNSGIDEIYVAYIRSRLDDYLQRKVRQDSPNGGSIRIREFECYNAGEWRWRRLRAMSVSDLRGCLAHRRINVARDQAAIRALEAILDLLENTPTANSVEDIWDEALLEIVAA